jgi:hypothetical protein
MEDRDDEMTCLRQQLQAAEALALAAARDAEAARRMRARLATLAAERDGLLGIAAAAERFSMAVARGEDLSATGKALERALRAHFDPQGRTERAWLPTEIAIHQERAAAAEAHELHSVAAHEAFVAGCLAACERAEARRHDAERREVEARREAQRAVIRAYEAERAARDLLAQIGAAVADTTPELASWLSAVAPPARPERAHSPSDVIARLRGFIAAAADVIKGLQGAPFSWRGVDGQHHLPRLAMMGVTLVSKSHAERLGYRLKRGAQPVGWRYFGSPISRDAPVYVLECQCVPVAAPPAGDDDAARAASQEA